MITDSLQVSYISVIPPVLGFFVLTGLSLISILRGGRMPTNILFAAICFMGALINADVALVNIIPDKDLAIKVDRFTYMVFVFSLLKQIIGLSICNQINIHFQIIRYTPKYTPIF